MEINIEITERRNNMMELPPGFDHRHSNKFENEVESSDLNFSEVDNEIDD